MAVLARQGRFLVAEPLFRGGARPSLGRKDAGDASVGDLVLVAGGKRGPRVVRRLGRPDVARHVLEAHMLDRGLRRSFPPTVESEAALAAGRSLDGGRSGEAERRDLTDLPTFTIDPSEARDFDDAVSARREDGCVRVWVHIADVSAYARAGGAVEQEAYRRGTSVYVPGAVEPMLPEALSSRACSLVPHENRAAVTVEIEMAGTKPRSTRFYRSAIRSDGRLTYAEVDRIFAGRERAGEPWGPSLAAAREVAAALRARRDERGSLEVESSEPSFEFDETGHVTGVSHEPQSESHRLIEELMILANERVAGLLADRRIPALYRVHERPDPPAIEFLIEKLASLDVPTPPLPAHMTPQQAGELVGEASRLVAQRVRRTGRGADAFGSLLLRSLKQAYYTPRNLGHAGLASPRYCHFTSPIRRYPDLVVHRALLGALGADHDAPRAEELDEAGTRSSASERAALAIERDADDICHSFLLERVLSERGVETRFDGEVVGLIGAGAFVRFGEERFEGFLAARRMPGEWWSLNELETALVGETSGEVIRLGDPVTVAVDRVDAPRGRVDLTRDPS